MIIKLFIFLISWIASIFMLSGKPNQFTFFDEILVLFILAYAIQKKALKNKIVIIVVLYFALETFYSLVLPYNHIKAIMLDMMLFIKPYIILIIISEGFFYFKEQEKKILLPILFITQLFLLSNALITVLSGNSGAHSPSFFIYARNFYLAAPLCFNAIMIFYLQNGRFNKYTIVSLLSIFISMPLELQGKYFGFSLFFIFLFFYIYYFLKYKKSTIRTNRIIYRIITFVFFLSIPLLLLIVALDDLKEFYFTDNDNVARMMMMKALPKMLDGFYAIAGRGFASYCTPITMIYYPKEILDNVGISHVYGLGRIDSNLMMDGYFWSLFGETGFIGLIMYTLLLLYITKPFYLMYKKNMLDNKLFFLFFVCLGWIFIFSFGSGLMFGYGIYITIVLGMIRREAYLKYNRSLLEK